jgi:succinoglycan biosynthesis protein ExoM
MNKRISICVCTRDRREMLSRCLEGIKSQIIPDGIHLSVIVVDNNSKQDVKSLVDSFGYQYVHEHIVGLSSARNSAIETALTTTPDFIIFIDDDCVPRVNWLKQFVTIQEKYQADVVKGLDLPSYPQPLPMWIKPYKHKEYKEIYDEPVNAYTMTTCNIMISAYLINDLKMRFDERFNFTGGEDSEFMLRAYESGRIRMIRSDCPIVDFELVKERCTYWRIVRRQMQYATGNTIIKMDRNDYEYLFLSIIKNLIKSSFYLISSLFLLVAGPKRFRRQLVLSGCNFMWTIGEISCMLGIPYKGYKVVDGN